MPFYEHFIRTRYTIPLFAQLPATVLARRLEPTPMWLSTTNYSLFSASSSKKLQLVAFQYTLCWVEPTDNVAFSPTRVDFSSKFRSKQPNSWPWTDIGCELPALASFRTSVEYVE